MLINLLMLIILLLVNYKFISLFHIFIYLALWLQVYLGLLHSVFIASSWLTRYPAFIAWL